MFFQAGMQLGQIYHQRPDFIWLIWIERSWGFLWLLWRNISDLIIPNICYSAHFPTLFCSSALFCFSAYSLLVLFCSFDLLLLSALTLSCFILLLFSDRLPLVLFCSFVPCSLFTFLLFCFTLFCSWSILLFCSSPVFCSPPCCLVAPHDGLSASSQTSDASKKNSNLGEWAISHFDQKQQLGRTGYFPFWQKIGAQERELISLFWQQQKNSSSDKLIVLSQYYLTKLLVTAYPVNYQSENLVCVTFRHLIWSQR